MNDQPPAAIKATFVDLKSSKGRKVAQLWFEIPLEQVDTALNALGGWPMPDKEIWCGIVRLEFSRETEKPLEPRKPKRVFSDLPYPQQAALKSTDPAFVDFMNRRYNEGYDDVTDCADLIRTECRVTSRSKIIPGTFAGRRWHELLREFEGVNADNSEGVCD